MIDPTLRVKFSAVTMEHGNCVRRVGLQFGGCQNVGFHLDFTGREQG